MSWQIPTQIEQDIISGKATYRTFQTGNGGQSILPVPANAYVVIFGYDFSPAGGGFTLGGTVFNTGFQTATEHASAMKWFETQQISFYTGTDFYPFIHHVNLQLTIMPYLIDASIPTDNLVRQGYQAITVDNTPIAREVYITSTNDVTITHGLIQNATVATVNPIPVTNRTPVGLTYGGSALNNNTQTNYGPGVTPLQFMQPSPKDYEDFAFGLLPANADGQSFATPDGTNGLSSAYERLNALGQAGNAAANYFLCLHYALYQKPIPSKQG